MFEFDDDLADDLAQSLEKLKVDVDHHQLPTGKGNSVAHLKLLHRDSAPSSNYNSDTDEPKPRSRTERHINYEVELNEDYVSSNVTDESPRKVGPADFESLCVLGCGSFGKVYLVKHERTQALYAMKVLRKASVVVHGKQAENVKTERQILEDVRHPYIVKLFYAFQTPQSLHMILEYAVGGELFRHMELEGMFTEKVASFYTAELVLALEHLHSLGIVYRDLKPENCLLDAQGHVVLTDFGLSKVKMDGKTNTMCGTAEYMAPEILMGLDYDKTVDWWSLGILLYDMLTGSSPFSSQNRKKTVEAILRKKVVIPYYFTSDAKNLVSKLLRKNPNARLGAKPDSSRVLRKHGFFRKIDWKALERREMTPPIVPIVTNPELAENFDPAFTTLDLVGSPQDTATSPPELGHFRGFSFVNTSFLSEADQYA